MDKKKLNNEIILCRPAVRKAKVIVIRKILKKMKILKGCKLEGVKEKKLKKSERLFEKVQMIKSIKPDEVTKFALRNNDLQNLLKGPRLDLRENVLATLSLHESVVKQINSIKEKIPNWETELPLLLDSLGKKAKKKSIKKKETAKSGTSSNIKETPIKENATKPTKTSKEKSEKKMNKKGRDKQTENQTKKIIEVENEEKVEKIEKIDDPFFIEKKVIAPKLITETSNERIFSSKMEKPRKAFLKKETPNSTPFKTRRDSTKPKKQGFVAVAEKEEEKLHPSWAAKKVKLIKPFEGKKIKFFDE